MKAHKFLQIFTALPLIFVGSIASADLIGNGADDPLYIVSLADDNFDDAMDYMTPAGIALSGYSGGTVDLGNGESVEFSDANNAPPALVTRTPSAYTWWHGSNPTFLGTDTNTITIDFLNLHVVGVSFSISAISNDYKAWVGATAIDSHGNKVAQIDRTDWFGGLGNESAKRIGVYVADGSKSCSSISQIVIDPYVTWGIGDLTYHTNPDCATVPEPGTLALLGMGLFGLGVMRRRRITAQHA